GSEDLMAAARHRQARLARVGLGERRVGFGRAALRGLPRRDVQERARRIHVAYEIRAGVLDALVAADRTPALDTRLGVLHRQLAPALWPAAHLGRPPERPRSQGRRE